MKLRLTSRIILNFVFLAAVLLEIVGVLAYRNGSESLQTAVISEMLTGAVEKEAAIDAWIEQRLIDLSQFSNAGVLVEGTVDLAATAPGSEEARSAHDLVLKELQEHMLISSQSGCLEFFVMEPEGGRVVVSTSPAEEGKSKIGHPYFDNGKTQLYLQKPYRSVDLEAPGMTAATPMRAADGRVVAVLAARLDLNAMNAITRRRTGLRQTEDSFLVNADQFLVTQPRFIREPAVLRRKIDTEAVRRCVARDSSVILAPDYRGVPVITVYRWTAKHQLGLIVEIDQAEALAPVRAFRQSLIVISGLALLAAVGLAVLLARTITGPLRRLHDGVKQFAEGDIKEPSLESSGDEVTLLAREFHLMAARVEQRTAELSTTNEALQAEISERQRAEESARFLGSAVEQSKESIVITDAELDLPGPRIIFVNPSFTQMTGYTAEECMGKSPRILQGPRTDRAVLNRLRQNLQRGEIFAGEAINYRKDGTEFDLEWQIAPLRKPDGTITHFVAIQRDITERKRLEALLLQSHKMETVGKLAGGVAHEFNSIMTAIIGQCELLLGDLNAESPLVKNATEIHKAAGRAATLTRQLLAYGRKQILEPEILDLNSVLTGMGNTLRHLLGRNTDIRIAPATGLRSIKADARQIEQVITNMAMNAADAMPKGGKLTLETANVSFDEERANLYPDLKAGDYVMLGITDTGTGMSAEVKARVFDPFFSTKGVGGGTGLGLSTCYGIIKQSGGHISIYSEPNRGTTFKIYLPQIEPQAKVPVPRLSAPGLPGGTETILLVEDDPALLEMAATLLRRLGYTVLTAANGPEALRIHQQRTGGYVDLLFTDVVMPQMGGKELADRLLALSPQTRVIFTSAYTEHAIVHQGVLNQGVALLQKPFTPTALAHKVREMLDQPRA